MELKLKNLFETWADAFQSKKMCPIWVQKELRKLSKKELRILSKVIQKVVKENPLYLICLNEFVEDVENLRRK